MGEMAVLGVSSYSSPSPNGILVTCHVAATSSSFINPPPSSSSAPAPIPVPPVPAPAPVPPVPAPALLQTTMVSEGLSCRSSKAKPNTSAAAAITVPTSNTNTNGSSKGNVNNDLLPLPSSVSLSHDNDGPSLWYEEEISENVRWKYRLTSILHTGVSKFQEIALLDTQPFGKTLLLDGKLQSAEVDEFVYHECLVHPALLYHSCPKTIFIMGGGEGSTAREILRHETIQKVVMCDIDEEVVEFCNKYLLENKEAFENLHLQLVINCARAELESRNDQFDIIIGDLADPVEDGPCYQLYSKGFYENVVKCRLNPNGIFVTQAGPAGVLSHREVFTSIYNTLKQVFKYVIAYSAHIPSYVDNWGWVMASDTPFGDISANELDARIKQRINIELKYLDGLTICGMLVLNKLVRKGLQEETHVYTEDSARFIYGRGTGLH